MKIIVLDSLLDQKDNYSIPTYAFPKIFKELQQLAKLEKTGQNTIEQYLKNHHGIKMKGVEKVFKYELTDGDRILYAYSKDFPWLAHRIDDSLVLLRFSKHDNQGTDAKRFDLTKERGYAYIKDIVQTMTELEIDDINRSDITMEDYVALAEILNSDDYTVWHKIYVIHDDQKYSNLSLDDMDIYLSNEQDRCISEFSSNPSPTLIIGGAGTGKTLIAVHLLINYIKSNSHKKACYFTQSPELRKKVVSLYKKYKDYSDGDDVDFNDINEYCIKQLGLEHSKVIYTHDFLKFLQKRSDLMMECTNNGISPIVVWTEIRGLIKGGMSEEWKRTQPIIQDKFKGSVQPLVERGYFKRDTFNPQKISLADSLENTASRADNDSSLDSNEIANLRFALTYFSDFDYNLRVLTEEEYLDISEERSSVEIVKRPIIYNICREYEDFLVNESLFDENDLIRMMFEKGLTAKYKYDFTVIDEVQDYTELQIYFIRTLTEGNKIVFAGDEHQNINPASFSESRLKALFYQEKDVDLRVIRLLKNYRCQQKIIDKVNILAELRREAIGRSSAENEVPEEAIRSDEARPNRLRYSVSNVESCLSTLLQYPKAVILVPDQGIKNKLLNRILQLKNKIISQIGEEKFKARLDSAVFTVAEIKGVEYEYVLCYNLIGTYIDNWTEILKGVHHQTKFRYFFNLLYVAMTRAQQYLCFVDQKLLDDLETRFDLELVNSFSATQLNFERLSTTSKEWFEQAQELEKNGKYKEALGMYKAANAEQSCLYRCSYHINIAEKDYNMAVEYALLLDSSEMVKDYLDDITSPGLKLLAQAYISLFDNPLSYEFKKLNISKLIETCIQEDHQKEVQKVILSALQEALRKNAEKLIEFSFDLKDNINQL